MDPLANWDDMAQLRNGAATPGDEDYTQYFLEYKSFDNIFNEALTTLQDLDVPSGYAPASVPPHVQALSTPLRHQKKPSGTAIFGFVDHNRELSLGGLGDMYKMMRPAEAPKLISPTQLARSGVLNSQLSFNFDQPLEECGPIHLAEEDERKDDLIVTNSNPKLYKFPPDLEDVLGLEDYLAHASALQPIHHPAKKHQYPPHIDGVELPKKYVPIPVVEPVPPPPQPYEPSYQVKPEALKDDSGIKDVLNMNMNVFLPPPLSLALALPEPHLPYSLPLRAGHAGHYSSPYEKRFYQPQYFSDDHDVLSLRAPLLQLLPVKCRQLPDATVDANETVLQLTPLKTPSKNKITLEWSPIILPNGKATRDVRRAIQELSPKRVVKKTLLLPPGELDRYWEGPDEDKVFTCTYKNCGKKFTRRYNVRLHIQTHLSDRPFTCTYCPKSFVRQHDLNRHVKLHMVLKHCRCKCGKEFTRVEGYRKHLLNGVCVKLDGVLKPEHRQRSDTVLDGLTLHRLTEELLLQQV